MFLDLWTHWYWPGNKCAQLWGAVPTLINVSAPVLYSICGTYWVNNSMYIHIVTYTSYLSSPVVVWISQWWGKTAPPGQFNVRVVCPCLLDHGQVSSDVDPTHPPIMGTPLRGTSLQNGSKYIFRFYLTIIPICSGSRNRHTTTKHTRAMPDMSNQFTINDEISSWLGAWRTMAARDSNNISPSNHDRFGSGQLFMVVLCQHSSSSVHGGLESPHPLLKATLPPLPLVDPSLAGFQC